MAKITDLTVGKPFKILLVFMIPVMVGNIVQQLYSTADTVIVGQTLSTDTLAGVGATTFLAFTVLGLAAGLTQGFAVYVAQRFGAHDGDGVKRAFAQSILLSLISAAVLTLISVTAARPLLILLKT
ncbi:MAG: MATE family efflux transporter, partial [Clostridiales bacterium]|nr:MATE family efflux transporter [Clostridiales bacterium]